MNWLFDLFGFFVQTKIMRRRVPLIASFKLTYRCNLHCPGCPFHLRSQNADAYMDWATAVRTLRELKKLGCRIVVFEGGEPFLWQSDGHTLKDLVEAARDEFMRVAVTTNGTYPIDVPADVVWVSVDGGKQTHDRLRCDSFDRAKANVKSTTHPKVLFHFTINKDNWQEVGAVVRLAKEIPTVKGMTVQFFYPYQDGEASLALSREQRKKVVQDLLELKKAGAPILNSASRLKAMVENDWTCHEWLLANVDPDGSTTQGCYVKNRGKVQCAECGFTPVAEASGAWQMNPGSLLAGWRTFIRRR